MARLKGLSKLKKFKDLTGIRTCYRPVCSTLPRPFMLTCAHTYPTKIGVKLKTDVHCALSIVLCAENQWLLYQLRRKCISDALLKTIK
jgi:hypothetical protein